MTELRTESQTDPRPLRAVEDLLHRLADNTLVGIQVLLDGKYAYANLKLAGIFGYTVQELLDLDSWTRVVAPSDREMVIDQIRRRLSGQTPHAHYVFRGLRKEGREIDLEIRSDRIDLDGRPAVLGMLIDVTDKRRVEEQSRQSQRMEAIGRLAGGIAHDFNNLLTVMLGYCELGLASSRTGDPMHEAFEEIFKAGTRAAALTQQLLAFSRRQVLQPKIVDVHRLLSELEKMFARILGEDIDLVFVLNPDLWRVRVDSGQMEQVLINLAANSRDAMPQGGMLTIEASNVELDDDYVRMHSNAHIGKHVRLTVSDTGCGMEPAILSRVFEPFFTTKEPSQGTGLGMSTVFGIVMQSGGHIEAYSERGVGTTFKIYIPAYLGEPEPAEPAPPLPETHRGHETVLLVEDEPGVRRLAQASLERSGYRVLVAQDGKEALGISARHIDEIHLLVTDVVMPNLSGRQLAERLLTERVNIKVLYISGYPDDAIVRHGILHQGTAFLEKPFSPAALVRKVRDVLDQPLVR